MKYKILNNIEIKIYFVLWISAVFYSLYEIFCATNDFFSSPYFEDTYEDFSSRGNFLSRKKDISDSEWKYVKIVINSSIPWCFLHMIVAEFLRKVNFKQFLIYWYTIISITFVLYNFSAKIAIYFSIQPLFGYLALQFKSKLIVWCYYLFSLVVINYYKWQNFEILNLHNYFEYITTSAIFWINLRSLNYFLEVVNNEKLRKVSLKNIFTAYSYCLYLPFLFVGPLVLFLDFNLALESSKYRNFYTRFKELIINLLRYTFWYIFLEFSLHIMYVSALSFQPQLMKNINSWALYGAGYWMGQFFQMKYVIFYGLSTTLAKFEDIKCPETPKCIGRIHLYSDMWKYFDRGLYLFLLKYIYIPISGIKKSVLHKLFASFICFSFVYIWHGIQSFIAIWSLLNFIGVTIETVAHTISETNLYQNLITKRLSTKMHRRFVCFLATPLFAMSAISNFYFFAGKEIGDIYMKRFLHDSMFVTINIFIVLYFGSQVSTEIKIWEQEKLNKKHKK